MNQQTIIRSYYAIAGLYTLAAALIWGINTLFLLDAGLDIFEVFIANAAFTAGMVLFEIPTGVLADTRGRRFSFLLSVLILLVTTLAYIGIARMNGGMIAFACVSVITGLGFTFYSGAVEAWLVDALKSVGYNDSLDRVFARGAMVTGACMLIGTLLGGYLGNIDLELPYLVRSTLLLLVFGAGILLMHDLGFQPRTLRLSALPEEMRQITRTSIQLGWQQPAIRLLMLASFVQMGFMIWGFYAWQPYFLQLLGYDAVWVAGTIAALIAASTIIGNTIVDWFTRFCGKRTTLLIAAGIIQTVAAVGVGLTDSFWLAVTLYLFVTAALGIYGPVKQAVIHNIVPSENRASVISFDSMFANAGGVIGQSGLGYVARIRSIAEAYVFGGLILILLLPLLLKLRGLNEKADIITGTRAGSRSHCAGQGLPETSQLDTARRH